MGFLSREHEDDVKDVHYAIQVKKGKPITIDLRDGSDLSMFKEVQLQQATATKKSLAIKALRSQPTASDPPPVRYSAPASGVASAEATGMMRINTSLRRRNPGVKGAL